MPVCFNLFSLFLSKITNHGVGSRPNLLTTFITPIAIFSSYELYRSSNYIKVLGCMVQSPLALEDTRKLKIFLISLLLLESLQICAFVSLDLLLFYIFFESVK